jgi:hypothetical protein
MILTDLGVAAQWAAIICGAGVVGGGIITGYKLFSKLDRVESQLRPNGGGTRSTGDTLIRIERTLQDHIIADQTIQSMMLERLDRIDQSLGRLGPHAK